MTLRWARRFASLGLWALVLIGPAVVRADVIFSNFGPGQSYVQFNGTPVGNGFDGNTSYAEGEAFTPTQDYTLTSIQLPLFLKLAGDESFPGVTSSDITVALTSDAGNQPGTVLESFIIPSNSTIGPEGAYNTPFVFNSTTFAPLTGGTQYWVTVSDGTTDDGIRWNWNDQFSTTFNENAVSTDAGSTWALSGNLDGAFEVDGIPGDGSPAITTPEPRSSVLVASGAGVCLLGVWLSRRFASRRAMCL